MNINKFNHEGYRDPTAYAAMTRIAAKEKSERHRPVVYICSPFSGDIAINAENARKYSRFAVDRNTIPIAPHLLFPQFMDDAAERETAMSMNKTLLGRCDELWVFGRHVSNGMKIEICRAKSLGMKIRYFTEEMEEVK